MMQGDVHMLRPILEGLASNPIIVLSVLAVLLF